MANLDPGSLGFPPIELGEDELPDGAILIVRVHMPGDQTALRVRWVDLDWLTRLGMLKAALDTDMSDISDRRSDGG
jgi:hypothetical protein